MLNITSRGNYGLQAMLELAANFHGGVMQVSDISKRAQIPKTYLEQLLNILKKAGLIQSVRGNKGGYRLAHSPDQISVRDVLSLLEGNEPLSKMVKDEAIKRCYQKAEKAINSIFETSLGELVQEQNKLNKQFTFYI